MDEYTTKKLYDSIVQERELWNEVLYLTNEYYVGNIDEPRQRLDEIGIELGGCTHHVEDIRGLLRIVNRAIKYDGRTHYK